MGTRIGRWIFKFHRNLGHPPTGPVSDASDRLSVLLELLSIFKVPTLFPIHIYPELRRGRERACCETCGTPDISILNTRQSSETSHPPSLAVKSAIVIVRRTIAIPKI